MQQKNAFGKTPLHVAAYQGRIDAMQLLLSYGANVEATDKTGERPLASAAMQDKIDAVRTLIHAGANVNARNNYGKTAVWLYVNNVFRPNAELLEMLLDAGGSITELKESSGDVVQSIYSKYISKAVKLGSTTISPVHETSTPSRTNKTFVNECLNHGLTERFEPRFYKNIPDLVAVTELGNRGDYSLALDKLSMVWDEYKDFDFLYNWKAIIARKQGNIDLAIDVINEGLKSAISKASLCNQRATLEYFLRNVRGAVMWWLRSVLLQLSLGEPTLEGPFLYLGYVAQAVGENLCRDTLFEIVDKLTISGRLREAAIDQLNNIVFESDSVTKGDISDAIKYICLCLKKK
ncbi:MAG: ankyrin repeat domain-containing protein [Syntrophobacteraceae bacterium]